MTQKVRENDKLRTNNHRLHAIYYIYIFITKSYIKYKKLHSEHTPNITDIKTITVMMQHVFTDVNTFNQFKRLSCDHIKDELF